MKFHRALFATALGAAVPAWAVYAPIPESEQGQALTVSVQGGVTYDSNIFGSRNNQIDSLVFNFSPKVAFNASVTEQTFFSGSYQLSVDVYSDRPGSKTLASHTAYARLAHAFTQTTNLDLSDTFLKQRNPQALLAGIPINTDQSYKNNEFNVIFSTDLGPRIDGKVKFRNTIYRYDSPALATNLDRTEYLYGLQGDYSVLPELKAAVEYRHQDINYRSFGSVKDKKSNYLMVGGDYQLAKQASASLRVGSEWRDRSNEDSTNAPYVELTGKYDYAQDSFVSGGYIYTIEETSNVIRYNDIQVNRFFFNLQHAVASLVTASASVTYEPSTLRGRRGFPNADDRTLRLGGALTWDPGVDFRISLTYDYDRVSSDDDSRDMHRNRLGMIGNYTF